VKTPILVALSLASPLLARDLTTQPRATAQTPATDTGTATGSVFDGEGRPIEGAIVNFSTQFSDQHRVVTTADGRFVFRGLPGRYRVSAAKTGYLAGGAYETYSPEPWKHVDIRANEIVPNISFKLWKLAVISGSVEDENGDPVPGLGIVLLHARTVNGRERFDDFGRAARPQTNDLGEFRLSSIQPGKYIVAALPARRRDAAPIALPRFFPTGSTQPADAIPLSIGAGDDRSGFLLKMLPAKVFSISGTLVGGPAEMTSPVRLLISDNEMLEGLEVAQAYLSTEGRFDFSNVPAGSYRLAFSQFTPGTTLTNELTATPNLMVGARRPVAERGAAEETYWGDLRVDLGDKNLTDVALTVTHGTQICGRVKFDGASSPPTTDVIEEGSIIIHSSELNLAQLPQIPVKSDGTFCSVGVLNGKYLFEAFFRGSTWNLVAIHDQGREVTAEAIEVKNTRKEITLLFSDRVPKLSGLVRTEKGEAIEGTSVLIFPADPHAWEALGPRPLKLRETRTNTDGTYEFKGIIPGHYRVLALPQAAPADWTLTENLYRLSPKAVDVEFSLGKDVVLDLVPKR
jgi:protocatechuate 3,4-dioxygenase beta subunit